MLAKGEGLPRTLGVGMWVQVPEGPVGGECGVQGQDVKPQPGILCPPVVPIPQICSQSNSPPTPQGLN